MGEGSPAHDIVVSFSHLERALVRRHLPNRRSHSAANHAPNQTIVLVVTFFDELVFLHGGLFQFEIAFHGEDSFIMVSDFDQRGSEGNISGVGTFYV